MANDISNFFNADPDKEIAAEGMRNHLAKSWDVRMRKAIIAHLSEHNGEGLSPLAKTAISRITA
ncbi:MAG TPA: formate dehydrogenase [Methylococcaceae bacterium]|nr:formate dehydrogenase [Methylococcaceae bacterium]